MDQLLDGRGHHADAADQRRHQQLEGEEPVHLAKEAFFYRDKSIKIKSYSNNGRQTSRIFNIFTGPIAKFDILPKLNSKYAYVPT